jgi:hypothetical protein
MSSNMTRKEKQKRTGKNKHHFEEEEKMAERR